MSEENNNWHKVCSTDELGNPGAYGFKVMAGQYPLFGFVVQNDSGIFGYSNRCPHAGRPLDWAPNAFLTKDKDLIMCSAHGATFELDNGLCVGGPCLGRSLTPWKIEVRETGIFALIPPEPVVR